ncbi:hypothetical protein AGR4C_Cc160261 [Agrobacterium tumefaciens str. Kerr 14]|uniref:Uncharacterized protein n=2 Tax=Agrobacterium TaxID=357 RepID=A0A1S7R7H6_9HYPH|nr:hypothetical protein AGR4C_Cc160261 [Agrobacterium tumefaciens str. Kerr 14]CUX47820.1 hypothetical protein AGR7C_Lc130008 [Agrobacterium deltaense Zutra 3/1]
METATMSEPCIIYTYTVHRDDPDFDRWEHVDVPDASYFSTFEEVRAEVMDLHENRRKDFPNGIPTIRSKGSRRYPSHRIPCCYCSTRGSSPSSPTIRSWKS